MSQYVPVPAEALEKTLDIISELRDRNAQLVAALEEARAYIMTVTDHSTLRVWNQINEALAQQSTEKP